MAYWVHGRDATTGEPGSMLSRASTPDGARNQAARQGLIAETIQLETHPVADRVDWNVLGPRVPRWLRFKIIGMVLYLAAIMSGFILARQGDIGKRYVYAIGAMGQLFFVAFACWAAGCVFQSGTWKNFKLGCGTGVVMAGIAFASMIALIPK
jgi:hypothetical protein